MGWLDIKVIDGVMSLREAGFVIACAFAFGLQIGHGGVVRWREVVGFFKMVLR